MDEMHIKCEPLDIIEDYEIEMEGDSDDEPLAKTVDCGKWKPVKIESILKNNKRKFSESEEDYDDGDNYMDDDDDDYLEEGEIKVKKEVKKSPKKTTSKTKAKGKQTKQKKTKPPTKPPKKKKPPRPKKNPAELGDEFICSKCYKKCANLAGLSSHYAQCGKVPADYSDLLLEIDDGIFCKKCCSQFKHIGAARIHAHHCSNDIRPTNSSDRHFICDLCGASFKLKSATRYHMIKYHNATTEFSCNVCGHRSPAKSMHEIHMASHLDQKFRPYPCNQCTKNFKTKGEVRKHFYSVHVPKESKPTFECDQCDYKAFKKESLDKHKINRHMPDEDKPFQCTICKRGFLTDLDLARHEKTHNVPRTHACPFENCNKMFKSNAEMKEHYVKVHTDDRPFICDVCERGMKDRHQYRRHLRNHERELGVVLDKSVRKFNIRLEDYIQPTIPPQLVDQIEIKDVK